MFVADWRTVCRGLDGNARARIKAFCRALEARTKPPGHRNGVISVIGLQVLEVLLFEFLNSQTGRLDPSYEAIRRRTGLARQSIAHALARLERCGVLRIVRRLCRQYVTRVSPVTGLPESYVGTTQATSLYTVHEPGAWAEHLGRPAGRRAPFPCRRQMDLLQRMELLWSTKLSLSGREKPGPHAVRIADLIACEVRS